MLSSTHCRFLLASCLAISSLGLAGCQSSLNCDDAKGKVKDDYSFGLSYTGLGLNLGVSSEQATKFDGKLGVLATRYGTNCELFKDGKITEAEYNSRNRELDGILSSVQGFSSEYSSWLDQMRNTRFNEMDKILGTKGTNEEKPKEVPTELMEKFDAVMAKLEAIDNK